MLIHPRTAKQDVVFSDDSTDEDEAHGLKRARTDYLQTLPIAKHPHLAEEVFLVTKIEGSVFILYEKLTMHMLNV